MNNKNKSEGIWVYRLFRQNSAPKALPKVKTYFAHRYPSDQGTPNKSPFRALFSDEGKNQSLSDPNGSNFQRVFKDVFFSSDGRDELIESALNPGQDIPNANESSLCHKGEPICIQFTVLDCLEETIDTKTFRLRRSDGEHFGYLPGQYVTLSVVIAGKEYKRSYSLASTPTRPGYLEITVKRDAKGGVVSNWLNDHLMVGDCLTAKGPFGKFTCAKFMPAKILFLAAGSGIAPIMSMLRWLSDTDTSVDVALLLSFRTQYDIIFGDELRLIAARHKNIKLFITLTKEPLTYGKWHGLVGRMDKKMIAECVPDVDGRTVYLCGPDAFMSAVKQSLQSLGLPTGQLFCESFSADTKIHHPVPVPPNGIQRNRAKTGNFEVCFAKSGVTVAADGRLSLLELAEKSGVLIGHECRAGNCGECMVKCLKGDIEMTGQAEIDETDRKKGWVYCCCAYPASNVVLDA